MDYTVHGILQVKILKWGAVPFSRGSSQPRDQMYIFCITEWINGIMLHIQTSLVAQLVMNLPAMWETWVQSLGWEDPLEKGKAIYSNILA